MLKSTFSSLLTRPLNRGWTCARCRSQLARPNLSRPLASRQYTGVAGSSIAPKAKPRRRTAVLIATTGGAATAVFLSFGDDVKNGYQAIERTGRVASALVICINDYRTTLNERDGIQDAEEKELVLKACHRRCALRTLRVLETNGGIFIKLGQHLVRPCREIEIKRSADQIFIECNELPPPSGVDDNLHTPARQVSRVIV